MILHHCSKGMHASCFSMKCDCSCHAGQHVPIEGNNHYCSTTQPPKRKDLIQRGLWSGVQAIKSCFKLNAKNTQKESNRKYAIRSKLHALRSARQFRHSKGDVRLVRKPGETT